MYWDAGQLVWDDPVRQQRLALAPAARHLLLHFSEWRRPSDAITDVEIHGGRPREAEQLVRELLQAGILISENSQAVADELRRSSDWDSWGAPARYFHFATRTNDDTRFADDAEIKAWFDKTVELRPSPGFEKQVRAERQIQLAPPHAHNPVAAAVRRRRSCRFFDTGQPVALDPVGQLLHACFAPVSREYSEHYYTDEVLKPTPSPGGRHPIEVYLLVRFVSGLASGAYHYSWPNHRLDLLKSGWSSLDAVELGGGKSWLGDAHAMIVYTAVHERLRWKYVTARALRGVYLETGHLSEICYLVANELGLGCCFVSAVRDSRLEQLLGLDGSSEIVIGLNAIGPPQANWYEKRRRYGPSPPDKSGSGTETVAES